MLLQFQVDIDVARILTGTLAAGVGVDRVVAAVTAAASKALALVTYLTAPAATATPALAAVAAVPVKDVPAARMGAAGDPWAVPRRVPASAARVARRRLGGGRGSAGCAREYGREALMGPWPKAWTSPAASISVTGPGPWSS